MSMDLPRPSMGRIVWYRSRTGDYANPAIITATQDGPICQANIDAGLMPGFTSRTHVHLDVRTPGTPGKRSEALDFKDVSGLIVEPQGGGYPEWDVPFWKPPTDTWAFDEQPPRTWTWPPRV